ncbi:MAG: flavodoxin [Desulfosporosinus sp.]
MTKVLIAFFSIGSLKIGNTEVAAEMLNEITGGDLYKINTANKYPQNMGEYDTIILGYPNWWGTMPMAVFTFLESYDFSGKTIIPFCTHEGSGLGDSEKDIAKLCPHASILKGLAIHDANVTNAKKDITQWLNEVAK